jgi:hypothetical protein
LTMEACAIFDCGFIPAALRNCPGGGIYNDGALWMTNCGISRCHAAEDPDAGGGIHNEGTLMMSASVIESCSSTFEGDGGGLLNKGTAVLIDCTVSNCYGFWGGGIESYGNLAITNSTIIDNYAYDDFGGGIICWGTNWLVGCTIAENETDINGGGICNFGGYPSPDINTAELWMVNCTVSGNSTLDNGSGVSNISSGTNAFATIYANHCTIVSNATYLYNGFHGSNPRGVENTGFFDCQNCIIAGNATNDFSGVLTSEGYNLIQNTNGCTITNNPTGNIYGADPLLGPLKDNGGPTWTHALLPGSPAIDQGTAGGLTADQRGVPRPNAAGYSDIGAFEHTPPPTACNMAAQTPQNQPLTISSAKLLACASSPVGYSITMSSVANNSTNGGTVALAGGGVTYTPPTNFVGSDEFTYTVCDGWGGTATGEVAVSVTAGNTPSSNMLPPVYASGAVTVSFAGIVGRTYTVQRAPSVAGPWSALGTATVGSTGIGSLQDTAPLPGSAFYRTSWP